MAFALAIKSTLDFPDVGPMFLLMTLIITAFTLTYSSIFLETTLHKCDIIIKEEEDRTELDVINQSRNLKFDNTNNMREKNLFDNIKERMENLNEEYLMPYVHRNNTSEGKGLKANLMQDFKHSRES